MIDEARYVEELLNILNILNKGNVTPENKQILLKKLNYIEKIVVNSSRDQFSDDNKFSIIIKLLMENKKLMNNSGSGKNELEEIKAIFDSGSNGNYTQQPHAYL